MKLVKAKGDFYLLCKQYGVDEQMLFNENGRPCVLLVKLEYRGKLRDFIIPIRSNISPAASKEEYTALPPNKKTKPKFKHGIHYIKMIPIEKSYIEKYQISNDDFMLKIKSIIDNNEKEIIMRAKEYLSKYESGFRHRFATNIDGIANMLDKIKML